MEEEKEFKFNKSRGPGPSENEIYTVKESELEHFQLDILYGQFMVNFKLLPKEVQDRITKEWFVKPEYFKGWKNYSTSKSKD